MPDKKLKYNNHDTSSKYSGFPFVSNIDNFVRERIEWFAQNRSNLAITPFIRMVPGFSKDGREVNKPILASILSKYDKPSSEIKFEDIYRTNDTDSYEFRPIPGIKNIDVDYKNKFGSIRKAVISWSCNSLEDLEQLSPYFLSPGHTIFLEWGWNDTLTDILPSGKEVKPSEVKLSISFNTIEKWIAESGGNYDAMCGIITNYNFTINKDGGFECTTEITSPGVLGTAIETTNEGGLESGVKLKTDVEKLQSDKYKSFKSFLESDFYTYFTNGAEIDWSNAKYKDSDYCISVGNDSKALYLSNTDGTDKTKVSEYSTTNPIFVSWGIIEDFVINPIYAIGTSKFSSTSLYNIARGEQAKPGDKTWTDVGDSKHELMCFNSVGSKISAHPALRSTDLSICIIPTKNDGNDVTDWINANAPTDVSSSQDLQKDSLLNTFKFLDNSNKFGYLRRIMFNVEFLKQQFSNTSILHDCIVNIFSQVSNVCGNIWDFNIMYNEHRKINNGNNLYATNSPMSNYIIDTHAADVDVGKAAEKLLKSGNVYTFNVFTTDIRGDKISDYDNYSNENIVNRVAASVIQNFNFTSKLSNATALNTFYSAHKVDNQTKGYPQNDNTYKMYKPTGTQFTEPIDTFAGSYTSKNIAQTSTKTLADQMTEDGYALLMKFIKFPFFYRHFLPLRSHGYTFTYKGMAVSGMQGMKLAMSMAETKSSPVNASMLVPVECELQLFGMSGIKLGDMFRLDYCPTLYKYKGVFQVIGLKQTVDKNGWKTTLKAGFRVIPMADEIYAQLIKDDKIKDTLLEDFDVKAGYKTTASPTPNTSNNPNALKPPTVPATVDGLITFAKAYLGYHRPDATVKSITDYFGVGQNAQYCIMFCIFCLEHTFPQLKGKIDKNARGNSNSLYSWAKKNGLYVEGNLANVQPGDIITWFNPNKPGNGHGGIAIAKSTDKGKSCQSIQGNTSGPNKRNGGWIRNVQAADWTHDKEYPLTLKGYVSLSKLLEWAKK